MVEGERQPAAPGRTEWMAAGNEQPAAMRLAAPARNQFGQGVIADRPATGDGRHVVIEVVQDQQDRHLAEDQFAQQGQPVSPRQVGPVRGPHRMCLATALRDRRMMAKRGGHPAQHRVDRHLTADDRDDPLGLQMAYPRDDLSGQRGLADSGGPVQNQPGQRRAGQVRGPAPTFGGADRERRARVVILAGLPGRPGDLRPVSLAPAPAVQTPPGPGSGPGRSAVSCGADVNGALSFAQAKPSGCMRAGVTIRNPPAGPASATIPSLYSTVGRSKGALIKNLWDGP